MVGLYNLMQWAAAYGPREMGGADVAEAQIEHRRAWLLSAPYSRDYRLRGKQACEPSWAANVTSHTLRAYAVLGQTGGKRPHRKPVSVLGETPAVLPYKQPVL